MTARTRGILDTSVVIAREAGRPFDTTRVPDEVAVSVVTVAELHVGIHRAPDPETRARRMETLADLGDVEVLDIDEDVCLRWAVLRARLAETGRRPNVNDIWIAATALRYDLPVVTQDADFDALEGIGGLAVIRI